MEQHPKLEEMEEFFKRMEEKGPDIPPVVIFVSLDQWRKMQETKDREP